MFFSTSNYYLKVDQGRCAFRDLPYNDSMLATITDIT